MGIIIKQSIKGSIWAYIGVAIGFVTTSYLYTEYLTPEVVGLFGLLISYTTIFSNFSSLGMNAVTGRLFTYFRNKENGHNGFLFLGSSIHLIGFLAFMLIFYLIEPQMIASNIEKSALFAKYIYLIVPLTLFTLIYNFLDSYNRVLYNAVFGIFLNDFAQRILLLLITVLYVLSLINLHQLIILYAIAISAKGAIILFYLISRKEINLRPNFSFLNKKMIKEIYNVALYSIIGGVGSIFVYNIDKIVINEMLDLSSTGVYTIAFYFGALVTIPSRPLLKISGTLIADAWRINDTDGIKKIYYSSCINQVIIGGFLFLGIWANIDNILIILGPDYQQSKWVIFFIGIGNLIAMSTGANNVVISNSKYYRVSLLFLVILIGLVITLLYTLIPLWGILGAAIAIAASIFLNNLMRFAFLKYKYGMQPFNYKFLLVIGVYIIIYLLLTLIPQQALLIDLIIRGSVIITLTLLFLLLYPVTEEIKNMTTLIAKRTKLKK